MFIVDIHNNVNRHCSIPLTLDPSGRPRRWRVVRAMRTKAMSLGYLVRNIDTGKHLVVDHKRMTNLY